MLVWGCLRQVLKARQPIPSRQVRLPVVAAGRLWLRSARLWLYCRKPCKVERFVLYFRSAEVDQQRTLFMELRRLAKGLRYHFGSCFALFNLCHVAFACFCGWRKYPPAQGRHASFSETRTSGAKQLSFCGAVARAPLIGVYKTREGAVSSKSKLGSPRGRGWGRISLSPTTANLYRGKTTTKTKFTSGSGVL